MALTVTLAKTAVMVVMVVMVHKENKEGTVKMAAMAGTAETACLDLRGLLVLLEFVMDTIVSMSDTETVIGVTTLPTQMPILSTVERASTNLLPVTSHQSPIMNITILPMEGIPADEKILGTKKQDTGSTLIPISATANGKSVDLGKDIIATVTTLKLIENIAAGLTTEDGSQIAVREGKNPTTRSTVTTIILQTATGNIGDRGDTETETMTRTMSN